MTYAMVYKHITKEGKAIEMSDRTKNVIDYSIKKNEQVKKNIQNATKEKAVDIVEKEIYNIKRWRTAFITNNPLSKHFNLL